MVTLPTGVQKRLRVVLVEWVTGSRGGEKLEQAGGAKKKKPCFICEEIALLRQIYREQSAIRWEVGLYYPSVHPRGNVECHVGEQRLLRTHERNMETTAQVEQVAAE
eukprot:scaffold106233_cov12-Prasinocladus_malaysianus.AAC.1